MRADKTSNGDVVRTPQTEYIKQGTHKAILYSIVDLGTQLVKSKQYGDKQVRQCKITFELVNVKRVFSEEKWEQRAVVSQNYTLSMYNSHLKRLVETLLGVSLTDEDAKNFDLMDILGASCMLQIIHNGEYANIKTIMWVDEDYWPNENELVLFDLDKYNHDDFNRLPNFVKEKIKETQEWQALEVDEDGTTKAERDADDVNEDRPFWEEDNVGTELPDEKPSKKPSKK